jgi:hypothetical protein
MKFDLRTKCSIEAGIVTDLPKGSVIGPVRFVDYQPGNGTRYNLVFTNINGTDEVGNNNGWLVTWLNSHDLKAMVVTDSGQLLHFSYVMEKMRACASDAVCLAEIIGYCTGRSYITCEEFEALKEDE